MKTLFNRTLSILCAVLLLISAVSAWAIAEEEPATPTDLNPAEGEVLPEEPAGEPEGEHGEEDICSVEVVITKALTVGQSWEGRMKKTKPAVLKLDVTQPGPVYILVEGKDVWATVEKSDRRTENPARTQTDPETERIVLTLQAEEGSYLITLGPVEPNLLAMATVTFMNKKKHEEWEAEKMETVTEPEKEESIQPENDEQKTELEEEIESGSIEDGIPESDETNENDSKDELEIEPVQELKTDQEVESEQETDNPDTEETDLEQEETDLQQEEAEAVSEETEETEAEKEETEPRHIEVVSYDDFPNPVIGDTTHFRATLYGYDELVYTVQWQYSPDQITWYDIPGETELGMDIVITRENNVPYWRIVVYVEEVEEMVEDQES